MIGALLALLAAVGVAGQPQAHCNAADAQWWTANAGMYTRFSADQGACAGGVCVQRLIGGLVCCVQIDVEQVGTATRGSRPKACRTS